MRSTRPAILAAVVGVVAIVALAAVFLPRLRHHEMGADNDMLAAADVNQGREIAQSCKNCHSFERGEVNEIGPSLYGIVGAKIASRKDFQYSYALQQKGDLRWDVDNLDRWIRNPSSFIPGNRMIFNGLPDPQDRMDLIAYLMTLK
ncbi:cytochrome c family protein [bacterium]|nr:cytochrome c family protein [bacterium]